MDSSISFCQLCSSNLEDDSLHNNVPEHVFNFSLYEWTHYRKALVKNRHGISLDIQPVEPNLRISYEERKGRHNITVTPKQFALFKNQLGFSCKVRNGRKTEIYLTNAYVLHPYNYFSLADPQHNIENGKILKLLPGSSYEVFVTFNSQNQVIIGSYKIPVAFNFQDKETFTFTIARSIIVSIEKEVIEEEQGKSPFTNVEWPKEIEVCQPTQRLKHYERYNIPKKYFNCIKYGLKDVRNMTRQDYTELISLRRRIKPGEVNVEYYELFWHILLWMEEMAQVLMLSRYNMEKVKLNVLNDNTLELEVPGLAEKRPSVVNNDMIDVKVHNKNNKCYRGIIKKVNDKTVEISYLQKEFIEIVKYYPDTEMDVRFVLSRLNFERMHQGVDQVVLKRRVRYLFPDTTLPKPLPLKSFIAMKFYNNLVEKNEEQRTAVINIIRNTSGELPYIVFGPPGTGKTVTIVEAILQLKDLNPFTKILVCAPANAACDMLADKLSEFCEKKELLRVLSETVDITIIPPRVLKYSNYTIDGRFQKFQAEKLKDYNIVVTTLGLIGRYQDKYKPDVVFVDEAAQACEPEIDCAIGVLNGTQIILAGDPKQLGPMSSSREAESYGFVRSLLERLMDLNIYRGADENYITMLKQNFRSHPLILQVPNELFYDGKLIAMSHAALNDPLNEIFVYSVIQAAFNKNLPIERGKAIEYCNVISEERREGRSPSYFNVKEAEMVLAYIKALLYKLNNFSQPVLQEDIGVVTPYIRQMYKIKELLKRNNFDRVEVGTTETFQGREKRVIIISTVRARQDLLLYDKKYNLGFVRNDKRFNVALTRAKSKLIVIGCAHVLATDTKWLKFLKLCERLGVACGATFALRTDIVKHEITKRLKQVKRTDGRIK